MRTRSNKASRQGAPNILETQLRPDRPHSRELRDIYHHHPESKKRKSSERISGAIDPYGRYGNAWKTSKTVSTIAILWPVKAIFEKRAAMVEVDAFISPVFDRGRDRSYLIALFRSQQIAISELFDRRCMFV